MYTTIYYCGYTIKYHRTILNEDWEQKKVFKLVNKKGSTLMVGSKNDCLTYARLINDKRNRGVQPCH